MRRAARLSLTVRFALVSLALVLVLGVAIGEALSRMIAHRSLEAATDAAVLTADLAIRPLLGDWDLADGVPPAGVVALDRAVAARVDRESGAEIARIKIWNRDGEIVYLADPHTPEPDAAREGEASHELAEALEGEIEAEIVGASVEPDNRELLERYGSLLEVYVPILDGQGGPPRGVFELYLPYEPVRAAIREDTVRAVGLLGLGLTVLWLGLFRLVSTASRRLREESRRREHLAFHDALTGLPNRALLSRRTEAAVAGAAGSAGCVGLLVLDLHRFREVNDCLGHTAGDQVLRHVASRLAGLCGPDETVARLGADEFAVLLPGVSGSTHAVARAEQVLAALREPMSPAGIDVVMVATAGVAVFPEHATDAETLQQRAELALEAARRTHREVAVFDPAADGPDSGRLHLLAELATAVSSGQLVLHYQPKFRLGGAVAGVEALVRWHHPERGLLLPADFLPLAESTGLIHPLTDVVLDLALTQARTWLDDGSPTPVAVNVSTRSLLDPGFAGRVLGALAGHQVPARLLVLELTETTIMDDAELALLVLSELAAAGVRLSIDDFGTGYSSLTYLKRLPVHELKIDRSFVAGMRESEQDRVIVDSTVALGRRLGLDVVAEGVEDAWTLQVLEDLGCELAQGFHLGRPVPRPEVVAMANSGIPFPTRHSRT